MKKNRFHLPVLFILALVLTFGLVGCDMSSESEDTGEITGLIISEAETVNHTGLLGLQEYQLTIKVEGNRTGTFRLENAILAEADQEINEVTIDGQMKMNIVAADDAESFSIVGEGLSYRVDLNPGAESFEANIQDNDDLEDFEGFYIFRMGQWEFYDLWEMNEQPLFDRYKFLISILAPNENMTYISFMGGFARWDEYEFLSDFDFEGDFFQEAGIEEFYDVMNNQWYNAQLEEIDEPELVYEEIDSGEKFIAAILQDQPAAIRLTSDITIPAEVNKARVQYDLRELDLNDHTINLTDGPLTFEGNGTVVWNGRIVGDEIDIVGQDLSATNFYESSPIVMVDGRSVAFCTMVFDVTVLDWYQNQSEPAEDMIINNSILNSQSTFVSNIFIHESTVNERLGVDHDRARLVRVTFAESGILYVGGSASLIDITWDDNFTGMYVGKSLKYYPDKSAYDKAIPKLEGATINTDKYGVVWWGINYKKAILDTTGDIVINDDDNAHGLVLLGTHYGDYGELNATSNGGAIHGDAVFTGDPVHLGWHTGEFIDEVGVYYAVKDICSDYHGEKMPQVPKDADKQIKQKNADRLTIHGPTFESEVFIFTPSNEYIAYDEYDMMGHTVWLGDVTFENNLQLWGDFTVVDGQTVTVEGIIFVNCDNIRRIAALTTGSLPKIQVATEPPEEVCVYGPDFIRRGTLIANEIRGSTCEDGVLVLGNDLLVKNTVLHQRLYNVILERTKLDNVDMYVGDSNRNDTRMALGETLVRDVHVFPGHHAILEDVMWSAATRLHVFNNAKVSFIGDEIDNKGTIYFEEFASVLFPDDKGDMFTENPNTVFTQDIRLGHAIDFVTVGAGQASDSYVEVDFGLFSGWHFEDWKVDAFIINPNGNIGSTCYELVAYDENNVEIERWKLDLTDLDGYADDIRTDGIWLTDLLFENGYGAPYEFDLMGREDRSYKFRIRAGAFRNIDLDVEVWGRNCCSRERIPFVKGDGSFELPAKIDCDTPEVGLRDL